MKFILNINFTMSAKYCYAQIVTTIHPCRPSVGVEDGTLRHRCRAARYRLKRVHWSSWQQGTGHYLMIARAVFKQWGKTLSIWVSMGEKVFGKNYTRNSRIAHIPICKSHDSNSLCTSFTLLDADTLYPNKVFIS